MGGYRTSSLTTRLAVGLVISSRLGEPRMWNTNELKEDLEEYGPLPEHMKEIEHKCRTCGKKAEILITNRGDITAYSCNDHAIQILNEIKQKIYIDVYNQLGQGLV